MRIVTQRVLEAHVRVDNQVCGQIGKGVVVLLGIHQTDTLERVPWMVQKLVHLRQFTDNEGKMNRSLLDINGEVLVVSQFTLHADCTQGRRPSFVNAAPPSIAEPIYTRFINDIKHELGRVQTGIFGAYMQVSLINDGPVTFVIDH